MNERDGLGLLVEENHQLKQMVAENDRQFTQIANFLNGDARDVTGEDKTIAGFVEQVFRGLFSGIVDDELPSLRRAVAKMSHRTCHACGHAGYYTRDFLPYCKCEECGCEDTRLVRTSNLTRVSERKPTQ